MLPIVLIHGFPLDASMWQAQVEHLRKKGHTVLAPNLPGFGGVPSLAPEHSTIDAFAENIHTLIQNEAGGKAIVGGFSMGGYVLLALLREFPESVAGAMFIDTRADPDTPEARAMRLKSIAEVQAHGPSALFDNMLPKILAKKSSPANQQKARAIMERQTAEGIISAQTAMSKRRGHTDLLAQLTIPVLILVGAEDSITPPSVALAMQSHIPHAMVVQVASAGHLAPVEQPASVNTAIDTFLGTVHDPGAAPANPV